MPVGCARVRANAPLPARIWVHARGDARGLDLAVLGDDGAALLEIGGLRAVQLESATDPFEDCVHRIAWRRRELATEATAPAQPVGTARAEPAKRSPTAPAAERAPWLVLRDASGTGAQLAQALRAQGEVCVEIDEAAPAELARAWPAPAAAWSTAGASTRQPRSRRRPPRSRRTSAAARSQRWCWRRRSRAARSAIRRGWSW